MLRAYHLIQCQASVYLFLVTLHIRNHTVLNAYFHPQICAAVVLPSLLLLCSSLLFRAFHLNMGNLTAVSV